MKHGKPLWNILWNLSTNLNITKKKKTISAKFCCFDRCATRTCRLEHRARPHRVFGGKVGELGGRRFPWQRRRWPWKWRGVLECGGPCPWLEPNPSLAIRTVKDGQGIGSTGFLHGRGGTDWLTLCRAHSCHSYRVALSPTSSDSRDKVTRGQGLATSLLSETLRRRCRFFYRCLFFFSFSLFLSAGTPFCENGAERLATGLENIIYTEKKGRDDTSCPLFYIFVSRGLDCDLYMACTWRHIAVLMVVLGHSYLSLMLSNTQINSVVKYETLDDATRPVNRRTEVCRRDPSVVCAPYSLGGWIRQDSLVTATTVLARFNRKHCNFCRWLKSSDKL